MFKNIYQLCTSALEHDVLCRDSEDYIFLWNCIAVLSVAMGIKIYCMCLMSNHFHILLKGDEKTIRLFFLRLKRRLGRYQMKKYHRSVAAGLTYRLFEVKDRRAFCQEAAYVLRNAYKARIDSPFSYPWCSTAAYFLRIERQGRPVGQLSKRERMRILKTKDDVPGEMRLSSDGFILPESFVDASFMEEMFGNSSVQFFNLLKKWNLEDTVNDTHGEEISEPYSDEEVIRGIQEICRTTFGGMAPERMDPKARVQLIRKVYNRFGSSRAQLLRLLPTDDYQLDNIL